MSLLILSNILEYTWDNRHKYACNTIVSEIISKAKPWSQEKKNKILKIVLEVCSRFFNICYAETRAVVRQHKHYVPRLNT